MTATANSVLDALGDSTRRRVFELLCAGPRPVGEIAAQLPVSRPAVSQHLAVLRHAGLVVARQDGRRHFYRVDTDGLEALRTYLESTWDAVLAAFAEAADRAAVTGPDEEEEQR
jgi:DNA-binding transcriptional ArsR family regulator